MRLLDSIFGLLLFGTSHVAGWAISPRPIVVDENTKASDSFDGGIIISIASDSSGVTNYLLSGAPEDTAPFELKLSNTRGGNVKSCADLKLRDQWEDENGNVVNVLDRESKSTYTMTCKLYLLESYSYLYESYEKGMNTFIGCSRTDCKSYVQ